MNAPTWRDSQQIVEQHPELLTEEAEQVLEQLIAVQEEEGAIKTLQDHQELL